MNIDKTYKIFDKIFDHRSTVTIDQIMSLSLIINIHKHIEEKITGYKF